MPPLQEVNANNHNTRYSPEAHHYVTVEDNRIHRGKVNKDIFSRAPIPYKSNNDEFMVLSQRDVIVSANPLYSASRMNKKSNADKNCYRHLAGGIRSSCAPFNGHGGKATSPGMNNFMDMFTNLCVCPNQETPSFSCLGDPSSARSSATRRAVLAGIDQIERTRKIVYPVARYPARLNSPEMVEQRRRSLQKHLMFRPVME